jgi:hypothetical protein
MPLSIVVHGITPPPYFKTTGIHQGVGQVKPTGFEYPAKGLPGYVHDLGCLALIQPFKIDMADGLKLFKGQGDFSVFFTAPGPEFLNDRSGQDRSGSFGSRHDFPF